MTAMQGLAARPRRTIGALALALAAAGVAVGSGADFTSRSANPSNTFTAGTLTADNSRDGAAVFSPTDMRPGGAPQTGTVDIANSGSLPAAFTLTRDRLESTDGGDANPAPFANKVNLLVTDCGAYAAGGQAPGCGDSGDRVVYDGTLAAMEAAAGLGDFGAGEKHRYVFAASLDASAGNEYQGDGSSARFVWDAAQK
jgi:spore coat-associated protein N